MSENRLARETSPYLLQHAGNPVDWYPWTAEAFERARAEDKPILLSVGYSACHWCHVMERESFEDPEIAAVMNQHFVSIKVDREERPDVDQIYMQAVQAMTGHGGWPMTVFLTPEGVPFYGGTYFPPADRHGLPGFPRLLTAIADAWRTRRGDVVQSSRQIATQLDQAERLKSADQPLTEEVLLGAFQGVAAQFDDELGGLGGAPKFPQPMIWESVLRFWKRTGNPAAREMVVTTLTRMARGGIYDQLGGGFHRYSVDARWLVPHFEKMLYDQGQLARLYLHAWLAFGDPEYRRIVEETLDYVLREMTDRAGGFYSAQDADSEGHEGKFFVWSAGEIREVLGDADAAVALAYWGMDRGPNFEGENILYVAGEPEPERIAPARRGLFEARERRVRPARDDKVLAAWNGLACRAFAEAGRALGRADYIAAALRNAEFVLAAMRADGRLLRTWKEGGAKLKGYLEDHAMVAAALLEVYEATFERRWLDEARTLSDEMLRLFRDERIEGFYDTGADHERLIVRPRNLFDNAVPCGSSVAIETLLRMGILTGETRYTTAALEALRPMADLMMRHPTGFGRFLCALDVHLGPVVEVALVSPPAGDDLPLVREVFGRYLPNRVVTGLTAGDARAAAGIPLLEGRQALDGKATAYVCRNYACQLPVTDREALARQLDAL
ncbi:MAG: thioredoxin domain-containing protein [Candidatus Rokubacteria bacterium]|nr:thioredoxin domain-containing protein [Candidatus Rokubacteria bacterium]